MALKELLKDAFEAGFQYANECECGKCDYCLTVGQVKAPDFQTWYKRVYEKQLTCPEVDNQELLQKIIEHLQKGLVLGAVKLHFDHYQISLKESKRVIDSIRTKLESRSQFETPESEG